jgi:hypothetical protein
MNLDSVFAKILYRKLDSYMPVTANKTIECGLSVFQDVKDLCVQSHTGTLLCDNSYHYFTQTVSHVGGHCGCRCCSHLPWVAVHTLSLSVVQSVFGCYLPYSKKPLEIFPVGLQTRVTSNRQVVHCTSKFHKLRVTVVRQNNVP